MTSSETISRPRQSSRRMCSAAASDHAALDFVHTVDWRGRRMPEEYLVDYSALLEWASYAGLVDAAEAPPLRRRALDEPVRAAALLRSALVLREAAHRLFLARALDKP